MRRLSPNRAKPSHCRGFYITQLDIHTHTVEHLSTSDQLVAEAATYTTQQTNVHALSGIGTHDAGNRGATKLRLRPQRDRLL